MGSQREKRRNGEAIQTEECQNSPRSLLQGCPPEKEYQRVGPEGYARKLSTEQGQSHAIFERQLVNVPPPAKAEVAREVCIQDSFAAQRGLPHENGYKTATELVKT